MSPLPRVVHESVPTLTFWPLITAYSLTGRGGFALVTSAAAEQLAIPLDDCAPIVESHEHYEPIDAHVFTLSV